MKNIKRLFTVIITGLCIMFIAPFIAPNIAYTQAEAATINKQSLSLYISSTYMLKIKNTSQYVIWKSENKKIATVSSNGTVKAKKIGKTKIFAIVGSGKNNKKYYCTIKVSSRLSCSSSKFVRCYADEYSSRKIKLKSEKTTNLCISHRWIILM